MSLSRSFFSHGEQKVMQIFTAHDKGGRGTIVRSELAALLQHLTASLDNTYEQWYDFLDAFDTQGDGNIDYANFTRTIVRTDESVFIGTWFDKVQYLTFHIAWSSTGQLRMHFADSSVVLRPMPENWIGGLELFEKGAFNRKVRVCTTNPGALHVQLLDKGKDWGDDVQDSKKYVAEKLTESDMQSFSEYVSMDSIWRALSDDSTVLVRGSWMVDWSSTRVKLPRRQDLPDGAIWDPRLLRRSVDGRDVAVVALSYCWAQASHPDPNGEQLAIIANIIKHRLDVKYEDGTPVLTDLAFFVDYCSLCQKGYRNENDRFLFKEGLQNVNLWYAHRLTSVWLLTKVPEGVVPYEKRGWPTFEKAVSSTVTPHHLLLDLGKLDEDCIDWQSTMKACKASRLPPFSPEEFSKILATKTFTNNADTDFVDNKYKETFHALMGTVDILAFNALHWSDAHIQQLADLLHHCVMMKRLKLNYNDIRAEGASALATRLPQCIELQVLALSHNPLGEDGVKSLSLALPKCPNLLTVLLDRTACGDAGVAALAAALPTCMRLETLTLSKNNITDFGAAAVQQAIQDGTCLNFLLLSQNSISADAQKELVSVWRWLGKAGDGLPI